MTETVEDDMLIGLDADHELLTALRKHESTAVMCVSRSRVKPECVVKLRKGLFVFSPCVPIDAAVAMNAGTVTVGQWRRLIC